MIIGIVCYFTIPSIANMVVNAGGGNPITARATSLFGGTATSIGGTTAAVAVGGIAGGVGMAADAMGDASLMMSQGMSKAGTTAATSETKWAPKNNLIDSSLNKCLQLI